jgi:hypothetical protein
VKKSIYEMNKKFEWGLNSEIDHRAYGSWVVVLVLSIFMGAGLAVVPNYHLVPELNYASAQISTYDNLVVVTNRMMGLAKAYNANPNAATLQNLNNAVEARRQAMLEALKTDPKSVRAIVMNENALLSMPPEVRQSLEQQATIEGDLMIGHSDDENGTSTYEFGISDNSGNLINLYSTDPVILGQISDFTPKKVRAGGLLIGNNLIVSSEPDIQVTGAVQGLTTSSVVKKTAVILFNWQDNATQPVTVDKARSGIFTSTTSGAAYHKENSYGHYLIQGRDRVDGDIVGYYTIPHSGSVCGDVYKVWSWGDSAIAAAKAAGFNPAGYDFVTFVFPKNTGCGWGGYALIWNGKELPQRTFINGSAAFTTVVIGHEYGHLFGAGHSNDYKCTLNGVPVTIASKENCSSREYKDPFDIMGGAISLHMIAPNKQTAGVFSSGNIQNVTTSGVYDIYPLETNSSNVQAIKIPRAVVNGVTNDYLYLEFRQPIGFDSKLSSYPTAISGVIAHIGPCTSAYIACQNFPYSAHNVVLDMTPGDSNFTNSAIQVGQTLTDSIYGVSVKVLSVSSTKATVEITKGETVVCNRANPSISINPVSQWGNAGQSLSYAITIKNNDSNCATSTFSVNSSLPAGFTQSPVSLSETLNPGASVTRNITVTSGLTTAEGIYQFTQTVAPYTANGTSNYQSSAVANYNVTVPTPTPTPTPTQTPTPTPTPTAAPYITVTIPNTAVSWTTGLSKEIRWSHNITSNAYVKIELSRDNGATWETIVPSLKNYGSSLGKYFWTVTGPATTQARIRVSHIGGTATDTNDVPFTIVNPSITVTVPNTAVNWAIGTIQRIKWYHNMSTASNVKIDVSRNGGSTWETIVASLDNAAGSSGIYDWTITGPATTQALIRVSTTDGQFGDASNVNFTIGDPYVKVSQPNLSTHVMTVGSSYGIKWLHNLGSSESVKIELSKDGGATYPIVITPSTASDGLYTVTPQSTWITNTARVRITWLDNGSVVDTSDYNFVIK